MYLTDSGKIPGTADRLDLRMESFYRKTSTQAVEQVRRLKDRHGRVVRQEVSEVFSPDRDDRRQDTLLLQPRGGAAPEDRSLIALFGHLATSNRLPPDRPPPRGLSHQELEFLFGAYGRLR